MINIVIIDMLGRTQMSKTLSNDDLENGLSILNLSAGVYSLSISSNNELIKSFKFVKQ
jgi:hypothetical protein